MTVVAVCLLAYLCGSIPFGYLLALAYGVDIRTAGSGNIGATNVTRQLGGRIGAIVFLFDFAKGAVPVLLARWLMQDQLSSVLAGISSLLGHMFPVWLRFRGGKGVATGTGVVSILLPIPALVGLLVWLATLGATRFVSLASILAAANVCAIQLVIAAEPFGTEQRILTLFSLVAFALVVARHAGNLTRLAGGRENQLPESPAMRSLAKVIHVLALGLWFGSNVFFTFVAAVLIFKTWETLEGAAGTRIAGETVAPMFPFFFLIQGVCALLALITALGFSRWESDRQIHRVRFYVLLLAALTVIAGWPLSQRVAELRSQRYHVDPAIAQPARETFGRLHTYSLFLNFGTIGLVTVATALAAFLPGGPAGKKD